MIGKEPPPREAMIFESGQRSTVSETNIRIVSAGYSKAGVGSLDQFLVRGFFRGMHDQYALAADIRPVINEFPLEEIAQAHCRMETNETWGKVPVRVDA